MAAYLDMDDIIRIAKQSGADAIHPGYGLLSENAEFARKVRAAGLTFVGPQTELLETFGDKVAAKAAAVAHGLTVIPGTPELPATLTRLRPSPRNTVPAHAQIRQWWRWPGDAHRAFGRRVTQGIPSRGFGSADQLW